MPRRPGHDGPGEERRSMRRAVATALALGAILALTTTASAKVLRVGSYQGIKGQFTWVQAVVKAARPGDLILIGPGDYKTSPSAIPPPKATRPPPPAYSSRPAICTSAG